MTFEEFNFSPLPPFSSRPLFSFSRDFRKDLERWARYFLEIREIFGIVWKRVGIGAEFGDRGKYNSAGGYLNSHAVAICPWK